MDLKWIKDVLTLPDGNMLMVGNTINSLVRNVITPIKSMVGKKNVEVRMQRKEVDIFGRTIWMEGADKIDAYKRIEGESLLRAYVDEWIHVPESFTKTMMSRLSDPGACVYGTCNPAGPGHYLYRDYIKRAEHLNIALWHFTLDDNPWLDDDYKQAIIRENPIGTVFYDRNILGNWVAASGIVFSNFDATKHVVQSPPPTLRPKELRVGIDYGTFNPTAFVSIEKYLVPGHTRPVWYATNEYYWDSTVMCQQKTDGEYSKDLAAYLGGNWIQPERLQRILVESGVEAYENKSGGIEESKVDLNESMDDISKVRLSSEGESTTRTAPACGMHGYHNEAHVPQPAAVEHAPRVARYASTIEVDPSAASFILQLNKDGMRKARPADNDVLNGIRKIATMISVGDLVITAQCPWLIRCMQTYSWNPDMMQDEVIKENDHPIDALRYVVNSL